HPDSAGVSSKWASILAALNNFAEYLLEGKASIEEYATIIDEHAHRYFLQHAQLIYLLALVEATKHNLRIEPSVLPRIREVIDKISPEYSAQVGASRSLRFRSWINHNWLLRSSYRRYIQWRYGTEHLA